MDMRSWRTTTSAVITAFFGYVLMFPQDFLFAPWLVNVAKFGALGGLVAFGISAKDFNVTGVTRRF